MPAPRQQEVTHLLIELRNGNQNALAGLVPLVYSELRRLASSVLKDQYKAHTFRTTDLVHEAFLKLVGSDNKGWVNRAHFFSVAATSMRQIIIDEARKRNALKRGGRYAKVSLDEGAILTEETAPQLVALDEALRQLATFDERLSRIVDLRFFAGLKIDEIAEVLSISPATTKREWSAAKAWLHRAMTET